MYVKSTRSHGLGETVHLREVPHEEQPIPTSVDHQHNRRTGPVTKDGGSQTYGTDPEELCAQQSTSAVEEQYTVRTGWSEDSG